MVLGTEPEELAAAHARSKLALATAVAARDEAGEDAVGAYYGALGRRVHEEGRPLDDPDTVKGALDEAGLDRERDRLPDLGSVRAWSRP
jgi:hypothetical protein